MPLRLLKHKSWHVGSAHNRERVKRDEMSQQLQGDWERQQSSKQTSQARVQRLRRSTLNSSSLDSTRNVSTPVESVSRDHETDTEATSPRPHQRGLSGTACTITKNLPTNHGAAVRQATSITSDVTFKAGAQSPWYMSDRHDPPRNESPPRKNDIALTVGDPLATIHACVTMKRKKQAERRREKRQLTDDCVSPDRYYDTSHKRHFGRKIT